MSAAPNTAPAGCPKTAHPKAAEFYEATGSDQLQFLMPTATVAYDKAVESIELFGKQVIPAFR